MKIEALTTEADKNATSAQAGNLANDLLPFPLDRAFRTDTLDRLKPAKVSISMAWRWAE